MKQKEIVYGLIIVVLIISIISIIFLKYNYQDELGDNILKVDNNLKNSSWVKKNDEYHRDINVMFQDEPLVNDNIYFGELVMKICNSIENICNEYNYMIKDNIINIYDVNGNDIAYNYELRNSDELVLTYNGEGFVKINFYNKIKG